MFTYLALLISYVYTVFYTILRYLSHLTFTYLALIVSYVYTVLYAIHQDLSLVRCDITCPYVYSLNSSLLRCVCMLCNLLDIAALSELEAQAFRYTRNNIC